MKQSETAKLALPSLSTVLAVFGFFIPNAKQNGMKNSNDRKRASETSRTWLEWFTRWLMMFIQILCAYCKKPIGYASHRKYTDEVTGLTFHWHNPECWTRFSQQMAREYVIAILKASRKEVVNQPQG